MVSIPYFSHGIRREISNNEVEAHFFVKGGCSGFPGKRERQFLASLYFTLPMHQIFAINSTSLGSNRNWRDLVFCTRLLSPTTERILNRFTVRTSFYLSTYFQGFVTSVSAATGRAGEGSRRFGRAGFSCAGHLIPAGRDLKHARDVASRGDAT